MNQSPIFYCASGYQLLNALNIKYHYYRDIDADVILGGSAVDYKPGLERAGVFSKIGTDPFSAHYTDYFIPDSGETGARAAFDQMNESGNMTVHIYEGGGYGAYAQNLSQQGRFFGNLLKQVKDVYLYALEVHSNGRNPYPLIQIPAIRKEDKSFTAILRQVFGDFELPEERYIFLQEDFAEEGLLCDDSRLLDAVAEIVGKENIAVRLHPNARPLNEKLYRLHGYRTYPAGQAPWELTLLSPELENKVLLSVSSTALFSSFLAGESAARAVSLFDLMPLSKRVKASAGEYRGFLNKLRTEMNKDRATVFCPKSMAELRADLRYIEGEL